MEAQIQCPPLLREQLKEIALEAWDQITPQRKPEDSYTKILQGPNEACADFLATVAAAAAAAAAAAKSLQSCLTLCNPIDGSSPGSPIPGILQARTLEWVAISFSHS